MEPLSAISLAAAIAQFVDHGFKIFGNAREIYGSLSGTTEEYQSLENAAREMQLRTERLLSSRSEKLTDEEKMLKDLSEECRVLSTRILDILDKVRAKDPTSKLQSVRAAWRSKRHGREILSLQRRLEQCRDRLEHVLCALSRFERITVLLPCERPR
jgi:signal transduction histidine kinase